MGKKGEVSNSGEAYVKVWPVQGTQTHLAGTQGIGWRRGIENRKLKKQKDATSGRALCAMCLDFTL